MLNVSNAWKDLDVTPDLSLGDFGEDWPSFQQRDTAAEPLPTHILFCPSCLSWWSLVPLQGLDSGSFRCCSEDSDWTQGTC